jgi:hypothetical protein
MAKIDTLSMLNPGIERAAITDLTDLKAELARIEARIGELDARLGTLAADMKIKQADAARAQNFGDKARARGHLVTLESFREERNRVIVERESLLKEASAIRRRMADQLTAAQKAESAAAEKQIRAAVEKLLAAFLAFDEADNAYRELKNSFTRPKNHWPLSLTALTPWQRNKFRKSLENYLKGRN